MIKKQILEFALKNWKAILIVLLLLVVALKTRYDYHLMENAYETRLESTEAQIKGLQELHEKELYEKQLLMENYLQELESIEREYELTLRELEDEKAKKTRNYARKFSQDKKGLIKDIKKTFGFGYVAP
jgi:hypothetical protein